MALATEEFDSKASCRLFIATSLGSHKLILAAPTNCTREVGIDLKMYLTRTLVGSVSTMATLEQQEAIAQLSSYLGRVLRYVHWVALPITSSIDCVWYF